MPPTCRIFMKIGCVGFFLHNPFNKQKKNIGKNNLHWRTGGNNARLTFRTTQWMQLLFQRRQQRRATENYVLLVTSRMTSRMTSRVTSLEWFVVAAETRDAAVTSGSFHTTIKTRRLVSVHLGSVWNGLYRRRATLQPPRGRRSWGWGVVTPAENM